MTRDSTENDSCKINKKLTRKNNHFDTPSVLNFFHLLSNHMCDFLYRKREKEVKYVNGKIDTQNISPYFGSS